MHPSSAAQSIAAARPHDTVRRLSHERHRPAGPDAATRTETAPVPSPDGEGIKGWGDRAEFRPIYFARSPHGSRIRSLPVMSAAGRLNTPGPEQSAHRAVREDALKGQVAGQGVSFHSFVFPDFLEHLVLSLTEFCSAIVTREALPGRSRCHPRQRNSTRPLPGRGGDQGVGRPHRRPALTRTPACLGSLVAAAGDWPTGRARHLRCPCVALHFTYAAATSAAPCPTDAWPLPGYDSISQNAYRSEEHTSEL